MVAVPDATPVTRPVEELTVATDVLDDVQVPPEVPLVENWDVPGRHISCVPDSVPAVAAAVIVTVAVVVAFEHPPVPVTV